MKYSNKEINKISEETPKREMGIILESWDHETINFDGPMTICESGKAVQYKRFGVPPEKHVMVPLFHKLVLHSSSPPSHPLF